MAQTVSILLFPEDRARLAAVIGDRNNPQKHMQRAQIVLHSAESVPCSTWRAAVGSADRQYGAGSGVTPNMGWISGAASSNPSPNWKTPSSATSPITTGMPSPSSGQKQRTKFSKSSAAFLHLLNKSYQCTLMSRVKPPARDPSSGSPQRRRMGGSARERFAELASPEPQLSRG